MLYHISNYLLFEIVPLILYIYIYIFFFLLWRCDPTRVMASSFLRFLDNTQQRTKIGRSPLDEWLARRRDLYLTTHNTHNRQTPMPPVGFEPTISKGERPQTYALDRAATGTGNPQVQPIIFNRTFTSLHVTSSSPTIYAKCIWISIRGRLEWVI